MNLSNKYNLPKSDLSFDEDYVFFNSKEDEREVLQGFSGCNAPEWDYDHQPWKFE